MMGNLHAESKLRSDVLEFAYHEKLGFNSDEYTAAVDSGSYDGFTSDWGLHIGGDVERQVVIHVTDVCFPAGGEFLRHAFSQLLCTHTQYHQAEH